LPWKTELHGKSLYVGWVRNRSAPFREVASESPARNPWQDKAGLSGWIAAWRVEKSRSGTARGRARRRDSRSTRERRFLIPCSGPQRRYMKETVPALTLVLGILVLLMPNLLSYFVAVYLIVTGISGLVRK
jgi:hypothetical protein